jgi:predicted DNA-binding ribbon-helix-helix protein
MHKPVLVTPSMSVPVNGAQTPPAASSATPSDSMKPKRNSLVSRNITIAGHRTSVRLEPAMWAGLTEICRREHTTMHAIGTAVAQQKPANTSMTAALRVFVMAYFRAAATEDGHARAGHGRGSSVASTVAPAFVPMTAAQAMPFIIGTRHG